MTTPFNWVDNHMPKERGGLGIKNLEIFNKALVGKSLWRLDLEGKILQLIGSNHTGGRMSKIGLSNGHVWSLNDQSNPKKIVTF